MASNVKCLRGLYFINRFCVAVSGLVHLHWFVLPCGLYMRFCVIFCLLLVAHTAGAARISHLTICSREHSRFTLYLDGQRQNPQPLDSIRVLNLSREFYHLRIEFEDTLLKPIDKNSFQLTDAGGRSVDVRYDLHRNRKGDMVFTFISQTIWPVWIDPSKPEPKPFPGSIEAAVQQRRAATKGQNDKGAEKVVPAPAWINKNCTDSSLSKEDFSQALQAIGAVRNDTIRMATIRQIISSNCISVNNLLDILRLFCKTDEEKLDLAGYSFPHIVNRGIFFKVKYELDNPDSFEKLMKKVWKFD